MFTMLLTELSVFKISIQFFGKAFLRIPNKVLLSKWKIVGNSLCNFCKLNEDYSHYFITCTFLKEFWTKFQNLMKGLGIENKITLNHLVLGYKIDDIPNNFPFGK
jgi:hypothetical protein